MPISPVISPFTETWARLTRCTTTRMWFDRYERPRLGCRRYITGVGVTKACVPLQPFTGTITLHVRLFPLQWYLRVNEPGPGQTKGRRRSCIPASDFK